jgi:CHAT domain-containing protein
LTLAQNLRLRLQRPESQKRFVFLGNRLTTLLLAPAAEFLNFPRLMIVADGALHYLPFAALRRPGFPHRMGWVSQFTRLPSASMVQPLRRQGKKTSWSRTLAIVADPVFDATDRRVVHGSARGVQGEALIKTPLPRLAFSRREAHAISKLVPPNQGSLHLGFDAVKSALATPEVKNARIVHLATHARIDDERPLLSAIDFSQVDPAGRPIDGTLRLYEIFGLDLRVELVVLGGCSTGMGKHVAGEGIIGFTRAFLYAGASNVLVSLWAVDDEATAEFMVYFYRHLTARSGASPAEALRSARQRMGESKRWNDPYYWAGFSLQGALD